jgi:hypothetical protein
MSRQYISDRVMTPLVIGFAIFAVMAFACTAEAQGPTNWNGLDLGQGCAEAVIVAAAKSGDEASLEEVTDWNLSNGVRIGICVATMHAYYEVGNVIGDKMGGWECVPQEVAIMEMYNAVAQWTNENMPDPIMMTPMAAWVLAMHDIYCGPELPEAEKGE